MANSGSDRHQDKPSEERPSVFYGTQAPRFGMSPDNEALPRAEDVSQQGNSARSTGWRDNRTGQARLASEQVPRPHGTLQPGAAGVAVIGREDRVFPAPEQFREVSRTRKADPRILRDVFSQDTDTPAGDQIGASDPRGTMASNPHRQQVRVKAPSVGKSTWDLHIQRKEIVGQVTGQVNLLPSDGAAPSGLQAALLADDQTPEYEVLSKLGSGSMGIVYHAKQLSLNRELAIKTLQPKADFSDHDQAMFVSEAVVTANLVHPNIVPIHDLGRTPDGKLFYSMKKVTGVAWQDIIRQRSLEDNLDIFMKVCDAVAYAHSRGVINRDLKPENVVVGSYGEVIVLDWGIAITTELFEKRKSILQDFRGGAGTPVYMAPELADPDISRVGPHSDIYLLGAILFEVLEGYQPHLLKEFWGITDPYEQFDAVRTAIEQNLIEQDVSRPGELMQIARKAMSTHPEDRFSSVEALQEAIREYRITGRAEELLNSVDPSRTRGYTEFQGAVALYSEALRKWPRNERALQGNQRARLAYAELAQRNGDIDLGLQILADQRDDSFQPIIRKLKRTRLRNNLFRTTWGVTSVAALLLIVLLIGKNGTITAQDERIKRQDREIAFKEKELEQKERLASDAEERAQKATQQADAREKQAEEKVAQAQQLERDAKEKQVDAERLAKEKNILAVENAKKAVDAENLRVKAEMDKTKAETAKAAAESAELDAVRAKEDAEAQRKELEWLKYDALTETYTALGEYDKVLEACNKAIQDKVTDDVEKLRILQDRLNKAKELAQPTANYATPLRTSPYVAEISNDGSTIVFFDKNELIVHRPAADGSNESSESKKEFRLAVNSDSTDIRNAPRLAVSSNGRHICLTTPSRLNFWAWNGIDFEPVQLESKTSHAMAHFTRDGKHCYLVGMKKNLVTEVWDVESGSPRLLASEELGVGQKSGTQLSDSALYADESGLLIAINSEPIKECRITSKSGRISIDTIRDATAIVVPKGKDGDKVRYLKEICLSPDGSRLALKTTSSKDYRVIVLKAAKDKDGLTTFADSDVVSETDELISPKQIDRIIFSSDHSRICTTHSADFVTLLIWDLHGNRYFPCAANGLKPVKSAKGLESVQPGNEVQGSMLSGHARVRNERSNNFAYPNIKAVAFANGDPDQMISVGTDPAIRFWKISTYGEYVNAIRSLEGLFALEKQQKVDNDSAAIFRESGSSRRRLFAAGVGNYVLTQQANKTKEEIEIKLDRPVYSVRFSTDGSRIVAGSSDLRARIFDSVTGRDVPEQSSDARDIFFAPSRNNLLEGHVSNIQSIKFLPPHGEAILTSDPSGSISVWDAKDDADGIGHELARLLPGASLSEFAISADGKWILAGGAEVNADVIGSEVEYVGVVWRSDVVLRSFVPAPHLKLQGEHLDKQITAVAIAPSSNRFATGGRRGKIVVWNDTGKKVASVDNKHGKDQVSGLAFLDDRRLISTGYDGQIILWEVKGDTLEGRSIKDRTVSTASPTYVTRLRLSPDGKQVACSELVKVKQFSEKEPKQKLMIRIWDLSQTDGGPEQLGPATKRDEGSAETASQVVFEKELKSNEDFSNHDVSWSSDGRELLISYDGDDEVFRLLDTSTWKQKRFAQLSKSREKSYVRPVRAALSPAGGEDRFRTASFDGRFAQLWDLETGKSLGEFRTHAHYRLVASFSSDRHFVATASEVLRVFNSDEALISEKSASQFGQSIFRQQNDKNPWIPLADIACSPVSGDQRIAAIDLQGTVFDWKFNNETKVTEKTGEFSRLDVPGGSVLESDSVKGNAVAWSPDGKMLACVQQGNAILRYTSDEDREAIALPLEPETECLFNCITFARSEDQFLIAAGGIASYQGESAESYGALWFVENGQPKLIGTTNRQHSAEVASDEVLRNKPTLRQAGVTAVAVDTKQGYLVTGGADGRVLRWILPELKVGNESRALQFSTEVEHLLQARRSQSAHESAMVTSMDILPDGRLVTADSAGFIYIWPGK